MFTRTLSGVGNTLANVGTDPRRHDSSGPNLVESAHERHSLSHRLRCVAHDAQHNADSSSHQRNQTCEKELHAELPKHAHSTQHLDPQNLAIRILD